jgi:hypothetical protein
MRSREQPRQTGTGWTLHYGRAEHPQSATHLPFCKLALELPATIPRPTPFSLVTICGYQPSRQASRSSAGLGRSHSFLRLQFESSTTFALYPEMPEPVALAITAACASLISGIVTLSQQITMFVSSVRMHRRIWMQYLDAVSRELSSLNLSLEALSDDSFKIKARSP